MNGRKRTVQIKFRVTEAERDLILEKMKLIPTDNMAAYLRKIAIDGYIIQVDHTDIKAMTAEIQKIGVNVNQIAKRANATGNVYQEDIEEIKGVLALLYAAGFVLNLLYGICGSIGMILAGLGGFAAFLALLDGSYAQAAASALVALLLCPFAAPMLLSLPGSALIVAASALFAWLF